MTPSILPMVNGQNYQFWPFNHGNFEILAMVMVKNGRFWPFDHGYFEILAMVMVKNFWPFDHDTWTWAKWSKNHGHLTPPPPLITAMGLTNKNFPQAFYIMIEDSRLRMFYTTVMNGYSLHGMLYW